MKILSETTHRLKLNRVFCISMEFTVIQSETQKHADPRFSRHCRPQHHNQIIIITIIACPGLVIIMCLNRKQLRPPRIRAKSPSAPVLSVVWTYFPKFPIKCWVFFSLLLDKKNYILVYTHTHTHNSTLLCCKWSSLQ